MAETREEVDMIAGTLTLLEELELQYLLEILCFYTMALAQHVSSTHRLLGLLAYDFPRYQCLWMCA
jgi:hypothetical protein